MASGENSRWLEGYLARVMDQEVGYRGAMASQQAPKPDEQYLDL